MQSNAIAVNNLIYKSAEDPGFKRIHKGRGFQFLDENGKKITDPEILQRIKSLVIPPAWKNVWISPEPEGHVQVRGIDARGRTQYKYHPEWNRMSLVKKFDRMAAFAKALPSIRRKVNSTLNKDGWPREKVIALIISILDQTSIRIGNKIYEKENGTYGLTTLRRKHLKISENGISFEFNAKGGLYRKVKIRGKKITRLIQECSELKGHEVFRYLDENGKSLPIYSQDVNEYLKEISGEAFTAKDFRTWGGTVGALELYPEALAEKAIFVKRSLQICLVKKVAQRLGNTVKICREYYIHPSILNSADQQDFDSVKLLVLATKKYPELSAQLKPSELIALYIIEKGIK
jgi:DNA topoisomerase-1